MKLFFKYNIYIYMSDIKSTQSAQSANSNPLTRINPVTQYNEFKDNLEELKSNINVIIKTMKPLVQTGLSVPCKLSRTISDTICGASKLVTDGFNKVSSIDDIESLTGINFSKIEKTPLKVGQNLAETSLQNTKKLTDMLDKEKKTRSTVGNRKNNITGGNRNTTLIKNRYFKNIQTGGGLYKFIINPISGRKVNINGKLGQNIIKQYTKYLYKTI